MSKSVGKIRKATEEDVEYVIENMRDQDRNEILASHGKFAFTELRNAAHDDDSWVGEVDGNIICLFGVAPLSIIAGGGMPWMVSTKGLTKYAKTFLPRSKEWIDGKLEEYGHLSNYVDERNTVAKRWLKWLGFELEDPKPYGVNKLPFHRFQMGER